MKIELKKKDNWKAYLTIAIIVIGLLAFYFVYYFSYSCDDLPCFYSHQEECVRTSFVNDQEDTTWEYFIEGKEGNACKINVKALNIKKGSASKQKLEGKDMNCFLPLGSVAAPEADIARCTGPLKEEMQNLIIQQLHAYIVDNVQEISSELDNLV